MRHPGVEALFQIDEPWRPDHCELAERLFPGSHARENGLGGIHPLHPLHPYNNGHTAMGSLAEANPFWIVAGLGFLVALFTMGGSTEPERL